MYRLLTPRWYVVGAGTLAAGSFRVYDYATNTWTTLSNTGLPATIGTDGKLIATPSIVDGACYTAYAALQIGLFQLFSLSEFLKNAEIVMGQTIERPVILECFEVTMANEAYNLLEEI